MRPSFGPAVAKVTIVEWSDFQCPYCARLGAPGRADRKAYPKDVRFVFRNFPLPMHPDAALAARAGVAAQAQGKFWQMHDWMYAHQRELDRASLEKAAASLGMDVAKFKAALDSPATEARVAADMQAAQAVGVSATPTFFVNGREHVGGMPFESLKSGDRPGDRPGGQAPVLGREACRPLRPAGGGRGRGPSGARN